MAALAEDGTWHHAQVITPVAPVLQAHAA